MAVKKFKKGEDVQLSKNFHLRELECSCSDCKETLVNLDHVAKLQKLRNDLGATIKITSGYRCEKHNKAIGGESRSQHKVGNATDIQVKGMDPTAVQDACEHFDGLGRYNTFTHVDSRGSKARWDNRTRKKPAATAKRQQLPDGPSSDDINVTLDDIEKELGL